VIVLIHISSASNFMDIYIVTQLSLPVKYCTPFEVQLANGKALQCQGMTPQSEIYYAISRNQNWPLFITLLRIMRLFWVLSGCELCEL
jgi:hypothetical protein